MNRIGTAGRDAALPSLITVDQKEEADEGQLSGKSRKQSFTATLRRQRMAWLDGLRAVCCIIIVCGHLDVVEPDLPLLAQGLFGHRRLLYIEPSSKLILKSITGSVVETFFAMAGYVCVLPFLEATNNMLKVILQKQASSLLLRYVKMAIPLVAVHLVTLLLWKHELAWFNFHSFPSVREVQEAYDEKPGPRKVFVSVLNGPIWILEPLMLAPFLAAGSFLMSWFLPQRTRVAVVVCVYIYAISDESFLRPMASSLLGVLIAMLLSSPSSSDNRGGNVVHTRLLLPFVLLLCSAWLPVEVLEHTRVGHVMSGVSLLVVAHLPAVRRVLSCRPLALLGPFGFSIYIWHHTVFGVFGCTLAPYFAGLRGLLIPCAILSAFAVSWASYRILEQPVNARLGNALRMNKPSSVVMENHRIQV